MDFKSSAELKRLSRGQLKGNYAIAIGVYLIAGIISFIVSFATLLIYREDSVSALIIYYLINLIITLLMSVLSLGITKFFLNLSRNDKYEVSNIFWGFSHHPDKIIITFVLYMLATFATMIPYVIFLVIYFLTNNLIAILLAILSIIAALVAILFFVLNYSFVFFILCDYPETSAIQALRESRRLMRGHKGRLFYISLSFIGYYLLGILSCFVGFLWIMPYAQVTICNLYRDIKGEFKIANETTFTEAPISETFVTADPSDTVDPQ